MPRTRRAGRKRAADKTPSRHDDDGVGNAGDAAQAEHVLATTADGTSRGRPAAKKRRNRNISQAASKDTSIPQRVQSDSEPPCPSAEDNPEPIQDNKSAPEAHEHEVEGSSEATVPSSSDQSAAQETADQPPTRRPKVLIGTEPERLQYRVRCRPFVAADEDEGKRWRDWITQPSGGGRIAEWFEGLSDAIGSFAWNALPQKCNLDSLGDATLPPKLLRLSPLAKLMAEDMSNGTARCLFMAWIWRILCDKLFSPGCVEKWKPGPWEQYASTMRSLQGFVTDVDDESNLFYFTSKYHQARLLYTKLGEHTDRQRIKNILLEELHPLLQARDPPAQNIDELVDKIVRRAVRLDLQMISSTYEVEIVMHDPESGRLYGFPAIKDSRIVKNLGRNPEWDDDGKEVEVDIILKPSIRQYGISDPCMGGPDRVSNRWFCDFFTPLVVDANNYRHLKYNMTEAEYGKMLREKMLQWRYDKAMEERQNLAQSRRD